VSPTKQDILALKHILEAFGKASGLHTNLQKTEIFPIACDGLDLEHILEDFLAAIKPFSCRYLGLPLHPKKLRKVDFMSLLNKIGGKLSSWKGKLMTKATRAQLIKSVLSSVVTYHVTVFNLPKWLSKKINKLRRIFF
jgi:hypothetical protein